MPGEARRVRAREKLGALNQIEIEITVVVVIEQRSACTGNFGKKELSRRAVEVNERDSGLFGRVY